MNTRPKHALFTAALVAATVVCAEATTRIEVLSNRADLVSGGDALAEIHLPSGVDPSTVKVDVDGRDVTSSFAVRGNGRFMGRVDGLPLGTSVLTAQLDDGSGARITIDNHPVGGPVFSGPQVEPWICETEDHGLGPAQDDDCNAPTIVEFFYVPQGGTGFEPYDPNDPPGDVSMTTTDQGETVPYVVRRERGTMNRGIHEIAVLYDPNESWEPWEPQRGWNGKILWPFGASCNTDHNQGSPEDVLDDLALSRGFMVANSSQNVLGNNCDIITSAETVMMLKEHITETYGKIRYTMGEGCSGGSIGQQMIANAYPGLVDGLQPTCSYPDNWSMAEVPDCRLLTRYFIQESPHLWANPAQQAAVTGHATISTCIAWNSTFGDTQDPTVGCGLPEDQTYDPETNPDGVRCTLQDYQRGVWGKRDEDGFARTPSGNVGIQYGLRALNSGFITAEQFVDLNEKIGGFDIDLRHREEREVSDPIAAGIWFRTGSKNDARRLDRVPIVDVRGTSNFEFHTDVHSYSMRQRLRDANGHSENQVIWTHPSSLVTPSYIREARFELMDEWLSRIEADTSGDPLEVKVVRNKPAQAVDTCWIGPRPVTDRSKCRAAFPYFGTPRIVAGETVARGHVPCALKPLDRNDYDAELTDAQWARLQATFPDGVCDYNRPSPAEQPSVPWLTFETGPGGQPLGPEPTSETL